MRALEIVNPLSGQLAMLGSFDVLSAGFLMILVGTAAVHDLRSHRIPNRLVVTGAIAALLLQIALHGAGQGAWLWFTGLAAGIAPFLVLYIAGAVGAGDAKLMACVGACAGAAKVPEILLATLLCGGVLAILVMLARRRVRHTFAGVLGMLLWLPFGMHATTASTGTGEKRTMTTTMRLPYAVAIAGGVLLVMTGVL